MARFASKEAAWTKIENILLATLIVVKEEEKITPLSRCMYLIDKEGGQMQLLHSKWWEEVAGIFCHDPGPHYLKPIITITTNCHN